MTNRETIQCRHRERSISNSRSHRFPRPRITQEHERLFHRLKSEIVQLQRRFEVTKIYLNLRLTKDGVWIYFFNCSGFRIEAKKLRELVERLRRDFRIVGKRYQIAKKILNGMTKAREILKGRNEKK